MIHTQAFSEVGGHRVNEDAYLVQPHPLDPSAWICFVADGQGGRAGGGRASSLACQTAAAAAKLTEKTLEDQRAWSGLLRAVDEAVRTDPDAGFTTFVGLCVIRDRVVGVSCGDSAALLVSVNGAVELTAAQRKNPPVGSGTALGVPFAANMTAPWRLLVMTDGVWKYVGWQRVAEAARLATGSEVVAELQRAARLEGSGQFQDDFTVVLLEQPRPAAAG